jgi:hypothetical protein
VIVRLGRRVSRPLHRWAVGQLDQVLATSPAVAASCPRRANGVQVDVVPPGIESDTGAGLSRQEIAARLGLDPTKTWTLCVAPLVASSKLERLIWAIDQLGDNVRAVVLSGEGRHFCGGNDLDEFATMTPDNASERMWRVRRAFFAISECAVPVIGAVHGVAWRVDPASRAGVWPRPQHGAKILATKGFP